MNEKDKYRLFCQQESTIPIFSREWWLDITCGTNNWNVINIEEKGHTIASMPFFIPTSKVIYMPAYTQTLGPHFAADTQTRKKFRHSTIAFQHKHCLKLIEKIPSFSYFHQNFNYEITDWLPFYWRGFKQTTKYTYILNNIKDFEALWNNLGINTKRSIEKAKNRFHINIVREVDKESFLKLNKQTYNRQQMKEQGDTFVLSKLIDASRKRNQGDLWGAYDAEGRLHAALFVVWQKSSAWYVCGATDDEYRKTGAMSLLLWETIKQVSEYTDKFDFEGSMLQGVERFFREFGAQQTPYFSISKGRLHLTDRLIIKIKKLYERRQS